ncbi:MAG: hypothetical protein KJ550_03680 [Proteobacteria bacterium]|nr:hypothetical protein [Desulfobacteraceae bacterium]MBU3979969.1 hypothetical protein [Pseudomonadota bacterium]MBU4012546.1 hypothetical protein [Pseudomonadota bacterium]MBU4068336.1 hypothetical protein [Pseudomonadota bacterium]MBU4099993.1 hypothetical protein [Pseudomonadota bacterium]
MNKKKYPSCFGLLDTVFPKKENGLRVTPDNCLACYHKTECLKSAIQGPGGLKVKDEFVDRAYESGMIGFLERWSKKKDINRKLKEQGSEVRGQKSEARGQRAEGGD